MLAPAAHRYIPAIGGVPIAYTDLRVLRPLGLIRDELPHIFVPVEMCVLVFRPQVGTLLGTTAQRDGVNTRANAHAGVARAGAK